MSKKCATVFSGAIPLSLRNVVLDAHSDQLDRALWLADCLMSNRQELLIQNDLALIAQDYELANILTNAIVNIDDSVRSLKNYILDRLEK